MLKIKKDAILYFKNTISNHYQNRKPSFIKRDIKKINTCIEIINDLKKSKLTYTDTFEINPLEIEINIYGINDDYYDLFNDTLRNI